MNEFTHIINSITEKLKAKLYHSYLPVVYSEIVYDVVNESIDKAYKNKMLYIEVFNVDNFNKFIEELADTTKECVQSVSNSEVALTYYNLILEMKDIFISLFVYISRTYPEYKKLNGYLINDYVNEKNETFFLLDMDFEKEYYSYLLPFTRDENTGPSYLYDFRGHWIIFNAVFGNNDVLEFKVFIESLVKIVRNEKYQIENKIHVGFILLEFLSPFMDINPGYIDVADDLTALANKIPINVLKYFNGWHNENLYGRILKNVD